jgi:prepilin-type processing-associated H-X9-DG protein
MAFCPLSIWVSQGMIGTLSKSQAYGPEQKIKFGSCENEYSVDDGCLGIYPASSGVKLWWNLPGSRHNHGCTFSFADGHSEPWKWHGSAVLVYTSYDQPADNSDDLPRTQAGTDP